MATGVLAADVGAAVAAAAEIGAAVGFGAHLATTRLAVIIPASRRKSRRDSPGRARGFCGFFVIGFPLWDWLDGVFANLVIFHKSTPAGSWDKVLFTRSWWDDCHQRPHSSFHNLEWRLFGFPLCQQYSTINLPALRDLISGQRVFLFCNSSSGPEIRSASIIQRPVFQAPSGSGVGAVFNRVDHRPEILHRCIQLYMMGWAQDQAAFFAQCFQAGVDFGLHIRRRTKW
jgi:hypothetical protein